MAIYVVAFFLLLCLIFGNPFDGKANAQMHSTMQSGKQSITEYEHGQWDKYDACIFVGWNSHQTVYETLCTCRDLIPEGFAQVTDPEICNALIGETK